MIETEVSAGLHAVAGQIPAPVLPPDLWRRGRRRRRLRVAAAAGCALVAAVAATLLVAVPVGHRDGADTAPAEAPRTIPSVVYAPLFLQRSVRTSPNGPAALVVSGEGSLRGSDVFGGVEGRTLVVGGDGRNRMLNSVDEGEVGDRYHLSPDGRYLAAPGPVDGAWAAGYDSTSVVDLTTGRVRAYRGGLPLGWTRDGRFLLLDRRPAADGLAVLDVGSGAVRTLAADAGRDVRGRFTAFSPDGSRVVLGLGSVLAVVDLASGASQPRIDLGPRRVLAGSGAWTPDGRIAVWEIVSGCTGPCEMPFPETGEFRLRFVDPVTGADVPGPAFVTLSGQLPRLLGWLPDGGAVVETYRPGVQPPAAQGDGPRLRVVALEPAGGSRELIRLPADAHHVDVARDLLESGRFGGKSSLGARLLDWLAGTAGDLIVAALVLALGVLAIRALRRRARRRLG